MADFVERNINDFNDNLTKIFNFMSINGKYRIIGSSNIKNILYNSDYDLETHFKSKNSDNIPTKLYEHFKKTFSSAIKNKNVFITDFKCGEYNGEPIRWNKETIKRGYQIINNEKFTFQDCLMMKSTIKLDVIYLLNGSFIECSDNYYIKIGNKTNFHPIDRESIIESINNDRKDQISEQNYYKALKREFSILSILNINKQKQQQLLNYFNSSIGILNKSKADLEILLLLLVDQHFRTVKISDIKNNLQIIKQASSYNIHINISKSIDNICNLKERYQIVNHINDLIIKLKKYINNDAKSKFFNKNNNLNLYNTR